MTELRTKRTFNDITLVAVGIFALAGGLLVFRSFADKSVNTEQPGTYAMESLQPDKSKTEFTLDINNANKYCLTNKNSSQPVTYTFRFESDGEDVTRNITRDDVSLHQVCLTSTQNYKNIEMKVTEKIDPSTVDLVVGVK